MKKKKKVIDTSPPKLAIKHEPGRIIPIPLMLYPRYLEENDLEPMPLARVRARYEESGITPPVPLSAYIYSAKARDHVLIVQRKESNGQTNSTSEGKPSDIED